MTSLMPRLFNDLSDWFDHDLLIRGSNLMRLEEHITDAQYTVRAELPGLDPDKDLEINLAGGMLTIRAERREESQARYRSEFRYGSFQRSVRLPDNADESGLKAHYSNGILEITVPLQPMPEAKRIEITTT